MHPSSTQILELCHCVQESQDHQLAKLIVGTRTNLELRNIRLLPTDIDALAFVANSVGDNGISLDFGACSMELECLDVLPRCQYIRHLRWVDTNINTSNTSKYMASITHTCLQN